MSAGAHLLFLNRSYHPDLAATGQLLTELAEDLAGHHGFSVTVVAGPPLVSGGSGAAPARERRGGVAVIRCRATALSPRRFAGRAANYLTYAAAAAVRGLAVRRPDVVVALTDPPIIGLVGLVLARRAGARFVLVCQDVFPEVARLLDGFRSARLERWLDRINRLLLARADAVVAVGETMRDRLVAEKGADPERVTVIHNWADCRAIAPGPRDNAVAAARGLAGGFVVMHSGNVGLAQDLDTVLDAAARLAGCPGLVVALVGDGARRPALEARARALGLAHVRFFPYAPKEQLAESLAAADVHLVALRRGLAGYVVPSKLYGILAAGRPYVAAVERASEVAAITERHACGLLAEPGDAADLADKVQRLYRDPALARRLGANARAAALGFDRAGQVDAYARLFARLLRARAPRGAGLAKRAFDVGLAALGLLGSAPLWPLVAVAVKLDDGGPVLFVQERVGRDGRRFRSYKFRSMVAGADTRFGPRQAAPGDARVTRVGAVLRATALDELPQLVNILKGDMSFVGPRPLLPSEIEVGSGGRAVPLDAIPGYAERHRVTPGLTGLAQVFAARDVPRRHKFRLDGLYVRRRSFLLDVRLIALSVWISVRGRWEHRGDKL